MNKNIRTFHQQTSKVPAMALPREAVAVPRVAVPAVALPREAVAAPGVAVP